MLLAVDAGFCTSDSQSSCSLFFSQENVPFQISPRPCTSHPRSYTENYIIFYAFVKSRVGMPPFAFDGNAALLHFEEIESHECVLMTSSKRHQNEKQADFYLTCWTSRTSRCVREARNWLRAYEESFIICITFRSGDTRHVHMFSIGTSFVVGYFTVQDEPSESVALSKALLLPSSLRGKEGRKEIKEEKMGVTAFQNSIKVSQEETKFKV